MCGEDRPIQQRALPFTVGTNILFTKTTSVEIYLNFELHMAYNCIHSDYITHTFL